MQKGAQVGLFDEKTRGRKSRDTVPLKRVFLVIGITRKSDNKSFNKMLKRSQTLIK
jgi:hypothetical protein